MTADSEELTIYHRPNGTGYLVASSQGDDSFAIYQRSAPNAFVTKFRIETGPWKGDANDGSNQNFKLVPWERVGVDTETGTNRGRDTRRLRGAAGLRG